VHGASSGEIGSFIRVNSCAFAVYFVVFQPNLAAVDLSLIFVGAVIVEIPLQSTLSDLFSGISLTIEKPYQLGDDILLEGGIEGQVVEINWRSTHLRNGANDRVVIPNSAIAKMRIQNHSAGTKRYNGTLSVIVDSRNEVDVTMELLKQAAMTCPKILKQPPTTVSATDIKGDRVTYDVSFNIATFNDAGGAKSELISQIYKRARPVAGKLSLRFADARIPG